MSQDKLNEILRDIEAASGGMVEGVALVSVEGLMIGSALRQGVNEEIVAAMPATLHSLGEQAVRDLQKGNLNGVFITGKRGYVLVGRVGSNALLLILARKEAKMGILLYQLNKAAKSLAEFL